MADPQAQITLTDPGQWLARQGAQPQPAAGGKTLTDPGEWLASQKPPTEPDQESTAAKYMRMAAHVLGAPVEGLINIPSQLIDWAKSGFRTPARQALDAMAGKGEMPQSLPMGFDEPITNAYGDTLATLAPGAAGKAGETAADLGTAAKAAAKAAGPDLASAALKGGAGAAVAESIPAAAGPMRWVAMYPAARQAGAALAKGASAAKSAIEQARILRAQPDWEATGAASDIVPAGTPTLVDQALQQAAATGEDWRTPAPQAETPAGTNAPGARDSAPQQAVPASYPANAGPRSVYRPPTPEYQPPPGGALPGQFPARPPAPSPPVSQSPATPVTSSPSAIEESAARLQQEFPQTQQPAGPFKVEPWHVAEMTQKQFLKLAAEDPQGAARIQSIADNLNRLAAENARPPSPNPPNGAAPPVNGNQAAPVAAPPAAAPPQSTVPDLGGSLPDWMSTEAGNMNQRQLNVQEIINRNAMAKGDRIGPAIAKVLHDQGVTSEALGKIQPGPAANAQLGSIMDDLKSKGTIDPKETTPNLSIPRIQFYLRQLESQPPAAVPNGNPL